MKLGSCCAILKFDWVHGTLFMALFRISEPLQKDLIIILQCCHEPNMSVCRILKRGGNKAKTYYKGVPYPFVLVNPIEMATTKAGNP